MTCLWDRNWTDTTILKPCDWVQCLRPPTPPLWSNLKVSNWDGKPYEFNTDVVFICKRGYFYDVDSSITSFSYTCQNGSDPLYTRGFFNQPDEESWPRCVKGNNIYAYICIYIYLYVYVYTFSYIHTYI